MHTLLKRLKYVSSVTILSHFLKKKTYVTDTCTCHSILFNWYQNVPYFESTLISKFWRQSCMSTRIAALVPIYHNQNKQFHNLHTCTNILVHRNHCLWCNTFDVWCNRIFRSRRKKDKNVFFRQPFWTPFWFYVAWILFIKWEYILNLIWIISFKFGSIGIKIGHILNQRRFPNFCWHLGRHLE